MTKVQCGAILITKIPEELLFLSLRNKISFRSFLEISKQGIRPKDVSEISQKRGREKKKLNREERENFGGEE